MCGGISPQRLSAPLVVTLPLANRAAADSAVTLGLRRGGLSSIGRQHTTRSPGCASGVASRATRSQTAQKRVDTGADCGHSSATPGPRRTWRPPLDATRGRREECASGRPSRPEGAPPPQKGPCGPYSTTPTPPPPGDAHRVWRCPCHPRCDTRPRR